MKKHPLLATGVASSIAGLLGVALIGFIAGSGSSYDHRWLTLVGVAIVCAVLGCYANFDGRKPIAKRERLQYSAICAVVSTVAGLLCFIVTARAWNNLPDPQSGFLYQLTHPWVFGELGKTYGQSRSRMGESWLSMVLTGFFIGGGVCYYGFRHFEKPD